MVDDNLRILEVGHPVSRVLGAIGLEGRSLSAAARALLDIVRQEEGL
jgi:hypothetical protein